MSTCIIIGELSKGELAGHVFELATVARDLAEKIVCVASTSSSRSAFDGISQSQQLGQYGIRELHSVDCGDGLSGYALADYTHELITQYINSGDVIILVPHTFLGRDIAAHLSVMSDRPLLANAISVKREDDEIVTTNMIFGGTKIVTARSSASAIQIVLVRPKSITSSESLNGTVECNVVQAQAYDRIPDKAKTRIESTEVIESSGPDLDDARIIITGGRGLGSQDNFEKLIQGCANKLNAATGATRAIVDAGWVPYSKQIGQTGKTVKPDVYIACGVSGATQHIVGMKGSKSIIAINTDDQAPIFSIADLGIVGDVNIVLPALMEKIAAKNG